MHDTPDLAAMSIADIQKSLTAMDIDLWTRAAESEISNAYAKCLGTRSVLLKITRSFGFLFTFSLLVICLWVYSHNLMKPTRNPSPAFWPAIFLGLSIPAFVMAGVLRHVLDWASQASGFDRAAWVANQLRPLNPQSNAVKRLAHLSQTCHACAAYERQILMRNRQMRLLDLGVMVVLNNQSLAARRG